MNVLVTGANGFIGFQVCKALLDRGYQVVALYHHRTERLAEIQCHPHLSLEAGDILDRAGLQEICEDHSIEGVCHLAIQPPGEEAGHPDR